MEELLKAREERSTHIHYLMSKNEYKTIVIMKANVPGIEKNLEKMRFICNFYHKLIHDSFGEKIVDSERMESLDGNYIYYVIDEVGTVVKEKTIIIEDDNALGRLIDIDVYDQKSISREDVACEMRRCLVCNNYAHICSRSKAHDESEIFDKIDGIISDFLTNFLLMKTIESIYAELDMYPKFGLVSRVDSGCHNDMDYETFVQSTLSIKPHLREYIQYGLRKEHNPKMLQEIGKRAEAAMFETTGNVNTQKGLIFALGLFLPVITKAIIDNKTKDDVISEIKILAQEIIGTYFDSINEDTAKTYGDNIYLKYGYKGIRGEALNGFEKVFKNNRYYEDENDRFVQYLIGLMSELKDTTILHRKDITTLEKVNNEMKSIIKNGGYLNNKELVHSLSNEYKELGISPGGSADLLVLKIIFEDLRYLLCGNEKNGICL